MVWEALYVGVGLVAVGMAAGMWQSLSGLPAGTEKMQEISRAIHEGAAAFLGREYRTVAFFVVAMAVVLAVAMSWQTTLAYLVGALGSALAGWVGMNVATHGNGRTAEAARRGQTEALRVAFSTGSVMGLAVAGLGLLGLSVVFAIFRLPQVVAGFSFGASSLALFARVGGGIYTKSADVGADLVGKLEAGIPEDDPRNPAVIADNVGDNVGDVAGMGADLFESYVGSVVAAMVLGVGLGTGYVALPLALIAAGTLTSVAGVLYVRRVGSSDPQSALRWGTYVSAGLFAVAAWVLTDSFTGGIRLAGAVISGLVAGIAIGLVSEYYTSGPPIRALVPCPRGESAPAWA